jgi:hypothetical protein
MREYRIGRAIELARFRLPRRPEWALDRLEEMAGADSDIVARRLIDRGAHGRKGNERDCVLARFLRGRCGVPVTVYGDRAYWPTGERALSPVLRDFVAEFDDGWYPELEGEEVDVA